MGPIPMTPIFTTAWGNEHPMIGWSVVVAQKLEPHRVMVCSDENKAIFRKPQRDRTLITVKMGMDQYLLIAFLGG